MHLALLENSPMMSCRRAKQRRGIDRGRGNGIAALPEGLGVDRVPTRVSFDAQA